MRKTVALLALLVASNLFWLYNSIDQGISHTYLEASFNSANQALSDLFVLSNPLFRGKSTAEIRELARGKIDDDLVFDKPSGGDNGEDLLVVGGLVFYLDSTGHVERLAGE